MGITKLLVANRGEIAVRLFRAAREMGIATVAVYSDVDRDALHVRRADEAVHIGPTPPSDSYLNIAKIIDAARRTGADAVHPGYGFLAENAEFAATVLESGLLWVGPPPEAIEAMGDKVTARKTAAAAGVDSVPGTASPIDGPAAILSFGHDHGWPVALKAVGGGGGRGFRVVRAPEEAEDAFGSAAREAQAAFGNPHLYLEKFLEDPRHIEVQVFGDRHGNLIHLGERECSLQRRHQKLIEESPSVAVDEALRTAIGEAAIAVARQAGYYSAGTVEFLLQDSPSGARFYFLEVNTRLQVEHPVTELVYGLDLAKEMLRVAAGDPLSIPPVLMRPRGHAIECRINAENPAKGFMPNPGKITSYYEPSGPGVRVDSGVVPGSEIPQAYDSLVAKLICWGRDRQEAIARSRRALEEFEIGGLRTTLPFHRLVMTSEWFAAGDFSTSSVERDLDLAALDIPKPQGTDPSGSASRSLVVEVEGKRFGVVVTEKLGHARRKPAPPLMSRATSGAGAGENITAPMQGTIIKTMVSVGDRVRAGDAVAVLEAMKMENLLTCHRDGVVKQLGARAGETVATGALIAVIGPSDD